MKKLLLSFVLLFIGFSGFAQIELDNTTYELDSLINTVLIPEGSCGEAMNITSPNNNVVAGGSEQSFGYFDDNDSDFPFEEGIVLATESIINQSSASGWEGDDDLEALIPGSNNTNTATVVEFEFTPYSSEVSFRYVLASKEYTTFASFVCNYADTFAFIISGPGIEDTNSYNLDGNPNTPNQNIDLGGKNIALLPGTNIIANPTNIHNQNGCSAGDLGEYAAAQLYDNIRSGNGDIAYNGQTLPLTAEATGLIPGETYTIKLALANKDDTAYDSAVYLEAGSFELGDIDLGDDITLGDDEATCEDQSVIIDTEIENEDLFDFQWYLDDEPIDGATDPSYEATETGDYYVLAQAGTQCFVQAERHVEFYQEPELDLNVQDTTICDGEVVALDATPENLDTLYNPEYSWRQNGQLIEGQTDPVLQINDPGQYIVDVANEDGVCAVTDTINVDVIEYQVSFINAQTPCAPDNTNTEYTIEPEFSDLSDQEIDQVEYEWSTGETSPTITVEEEGDYTLTTSFEGCEQTASITVEFQYEPAVDLGPDISTCNSQSITLDGTPENLGNLDEPTYQWFKDGSELQDETNPTLTVDEIGTYRIEVTNGDCVGSDEVIIEKGELPLSISADTATVAELKYCDDDKLTDPIPSYTVNLTADAEAEGSEELIYTWFRNGNEISDETQASLEVSYDSEGSFQDTYSVEASTGSCAATKQIELDITIEPYEASCQITEGLSPDSSPGKNDKLDLSFLSERTGINSLKVYNRYGRKVFDQSNYVDEWRGQDKDGDALSTGTYYYVLDLNSEDPVYGNTEKGWIYINRQVNN